LRASSGCAAETGFQVTPLEKVVTVEADL